MRTRSSLAGLATIGVLLAGAAAPATAQDPEPLQVRSAATGGFIDADEAIELTFSRSLLRPAEAVAVFIDDIDVTDLFERRVGGMRYDPRSLPLASGQHELVVYRVTAEQGWRELTRIPLQVRTALGFDRSETDPSATASWSTRVAKRFDPEANDPGEVPGNVDVRVGLRSEQVRGDTRIATEAAVVGASDREYALRFGELQDDAPLFDLSSYALQAAGGPVEVAVGHVTAGDQRHLIQGFGSRGATLALHPAERLDLSVAALHGNEVVGWGDLIGGTDADHRVVTAAVGLEAFSQPGRLRLEMTGMQGSVLPRADVNQGVVNDAEKSRGVGVRLQAAALDRRVRIDAGLARSTFDNPFDPTLAQGLDLVDVEEGTHWARYLDSSVDVLRGLRFGDSRTARLTVGLRHERVDPLYRSLGAYASADRLNDQVDLQADVGGVGLQANWAGSRDNLAEVASILTTKTRRRGLALRLPLSRVIQRSTRWLPDLNLTLDRTHQFGDGIPENGGFSASHIPDQVSENRTASANWRLSQFGVSYRWNRSEQDNRQEGRETADFIGTRHSVDLQINAWTRVQAGATLGLEVAEDLGQATRDQTVRYGFNVSLRVLDRSALTVRFSDTTTEDGARTRGRGASSIDAQWSSALPFLDGIRGQYFLRFSRNVSDSFDSTFNVDDERRAWWLDLGLDFTFF